MIVLQWAIIAIAVCAVLFVVVSLAGVSFVLCVMVAESGLAERSAARHRACVRVFKRETDES